MHNMVYTNINLRYNPWTYYRTLEKMLRLKERGSENSSLKQNPHYSRPKSISIPNSFKKLIKRKLYSFIPSEETFAKKLPVPPGIFAFVQTNQAPYTIHCRYIAGADGSWHEYIAGAIEIEDKMLSAGELIVGASGNLVAWSFRTGKYAFDLFEEDETIQSAIRHKETSVLEQCRLPTNKFFFAKLWTDYCTLGFKSYYFSSQGLFRQVRDENTIKYIDLEGKIDKDAKSCRFTGLHRLIAAAAEEAAALPEDEMKNEISSSVSAVNLHESDHRLSSHRLSLFSSSEEMALRFNIDAAEENYIPGIVPYGENKSEQAAHQYKKSSRVPNGS